MKSNAYVWNVFIMNVGQGINDKKTKLSSRIEKED